MNQHALLASSMLGQGITLQCAYHAPHIRYRLPRLVAMSSQQPSGSSGPPPPAGQSQSPDRLFSNVNPATLKHEPGSVYGAAALVSGTAVGAGILALPAVTKAAGFAASSVALTGGAAFSIITGLLVAEVTVNTLCELGGGRGVSIGSMAKRTLGNSGSVAVSVVYGILHYSLLVAYIAKAGETINTATGLNIVAADALFVALFGGLCYAAPPMTLDAVNSALVIAVLAAFLVRRVSLIIFHHLSCFLKLFTINSHNLNDTKIFKRSSLRKQQPNRQCFVSCAGITRHSSYWC